MNDYEVTLILNIKAEDRTSLRQQLIWALMERLPLGSAPEIEDIIIKEKQ